ncbi:MAG TPA: DUF1345 domain-containing protein [Methylomirabilota bacterium]|jgi:uncharacterized membrane protein
MRRRPLPVRVVRGRPRLFACAAIGVIVLVLVSLVTNWRVASRLLTAWDIAVALYLALALDVMRRASPAQIRKHAAEQDEGRFAILVVTVAAALASLAAIVARLGSSAAGDGAWQPGNMILATLTIFLSWTLIHTMFALHYAHEFYDETASGGLVFPDHDRTPDYWDFMYFAFVIGMTSQVSDVAVTSKQIRRTVAAHGVVAFVFNVALLALMVNLAASAI